MSPRWWWALVGGLLAACVAPIDDEEHLAAQDPDRDGVRGAEDCDGSDPNVFPGSVEWCNGVDDDCDGVVDGPTARGVVPTWADGDGDGLGANGAPTWACEPAPGFVAIDGDCDDGDASVGGPQLGWVDADGDGSGDPGRPDVACDLATNDADCDDTDPAVHPTATEVCNGIDDDCDATVDQGAALATWYGDVDGDGFGGALSTVNACLMPPGWFAAADDCDDADPNRFPGAVEVCNGLDDDCDGPTDEGAADPTAWFVDGDGDGWGGAAAGDACDPPAQGVTTSGDCDDGDPAVSPEAVEVCNGGRDDDCDGDADDAEVPVALQPVWFGDADGDGFGDLQVWVAACAAPPDHVPDASDCDDTDPTVSPAESEICDNGVDDDCDGAACAWTGARDLADGDFSVEGTTDVGQLGAALAAGDLDGDGVAELILGAPGPEPGGGAVVGEGSLWVFQDPPDGPTAPGDAFAWVSGGAEPGQAAGARLVVADLSGDVRPELVVAAPARDGLAPGGGAVVVLSWPLPADLSGGVALLGASGLGRSVAVGDLDDDSANDVLVAGRDGSGAGTVWLFAGPVLAPRDTLGADAAWTADPAEDVGAALVARDLTGDGVADAAIGAAGGVVYLVHGPVVGGALVDVADGRLTGGPGPVAALDAADLDGDGVAELLVGMPTGADGAVHVVPVSRWGGGGSFASLATGSLTGAPGLGQAVAAGDPDGDGQLELLVGGVDAAWLLEAWSGARLAIDAELQLTGSAGELAGASVLAADLDGDGLDEVLVAAPGFGGGSGAVFGARGAGF